jgi:hypothetical protein
MRSRVKVDLSALLGMRIMKMDDRDDSKIPRNPNELVIGTSSGRVLVRIQPNGDLSYGEDYTPDEAAKEFWEAIARRRSDYEVRLVFITHVEQLLARVGEQDLKVEAAREKAQKSEDPRDSFSAEMAMSQLQLLWHELIEFARGIAYRNRHNREEEVKAEPMEVPKKFLN